MKEYRVTIQVIRVYTLTVDAKSEDEAKHLASLMPSSRIEERGSLQQVTTDHAEAEEIR